jgi:hypothetical protein
MIFIIKIIFDLMCDFFKKNNGYPDQFVRTSTNLTGPKLNDYIALYWF